jgi:UPF0755 protein
MTRRLLLAALALALVAGAAALAAREVLNMPLRTPADGLALDVPAGTSVAALGARLDAEGVYPYPQVFAAYARITGQAGAIKAGEYEVSAGSTIRDLLRQLVEGRVRLHSLTIVEGWTLGDLQRAMRRNKAIRTTLPKDDPGAVVRALEIGTPSPEGWFFPDTYRFPRGTTDVELLGMAHARMKILLEQAWQGRSQGLPLASAYEALVLASIIEKETALDRERPQIAGVFIRRLASGMKLQTDPTVIYGLGEEFDGDLTRRQLLKDTPYNTYTRTGLPPSPIALPGEGALLAAVHPDDSDALYFVASGEPDGSHVFSANLRAHNAAVKKYLDTVREAAK